MFVLLLVVVAFSLAGVSLVPYLFSGGAFQGLMPYAWVYIVGKSWPSAECKIDQPLPLGRFLSWGHGSCSSLLGPCSVLPGIVCGWDSR